MRRGPKSKRTPEVMATLMEMRRTRTPYDQIREAIIVQHGVELDRTTLRNWYMRAGGSIDQSPNPIPGQVRCMGVRSCGKCRNWVSVERFDAKRGYCKTCSERAKESTGEAMTAYRRAAMLEDKRRRKMLEDAFLRLESNTATALRGHL